MGALPGRLADRSQSGAKARSITGSFGSFERRPVHPHSIRAGEARMGEREVERAQVCEAMVPAGPAMSALEVEKDRAFGSPEKISHMQVTMDDARRVQLRDEGPDRLQCAPARCPDRVEQRDDGLPRDEALNQQSSAIRSLRVGEGLGTGDPRRMRANERSPLAIVGAPTDRALDEVSQPPGALAPTKVLDHEIELRAGSDSKDLASPVVGQHLDAVSAQVVDAAREPRLDEFAHWDR
jgi:hypothetical protein